MASRWIVSAFGALLFVGGLGLPPGELRAQSYGSPQIRLPPTTASLVRTLLTGVSWRRRVEAAEQLGHSGDPRVLESLATAAAHDTSPEVRRAARAAIRQIRGDIAPPAPGPGPFPPSLPQDPNIALVDSWYQRYLGRSADPGGLGTHVALLRRGDSADTVQSHILGSDEFWGNNGGNVAGFVSGLYKVVLNRNPSRAELVFWARRYTINHRNRSAVSKELLEAAQTELLQRRLNPTYPW